MTIEAIRNRAEDNLDRVRNLLQLYEEMAGTGRGRRPVHSTDLLRAATVFLHAALEDFLRSVARLRLPRSTAAEIDEIPLIGTGERPAKFLLGRLVAHRSKSVEQLISESVDAYLDRSSFGNIGEVKTVLIKIGVAVNFLAVDWMTVEGLMQRRHLIVHRADRNEARGLGQHPALGINRGDLQAWLTAVEQLIDQVSNAPWVEPQEPEIV